MDVFALTSLKRNPAVRTSEGCEREGRVSHMALKESQLMFRGMTLRLAGRTLASRTTRLTWNHRVKSLVWKVGNLGARAVSVRLSMTSLTAALVM